MKKVYLLLATMCLVGVFQCCQKEELFDKSESVNIVKAGTPVRYSIPDSVYLEIEGERWLLSGTVTIDSQNGEILASDLTITNEVTGERKKLSINAIGVSEEETEYSLEIIDENDNSVIVGNESPLLCDLLNLLNSLF